MIFSVYQSGTLFNYEYCTLNFLYLQGSVVYSMCCTVCKYNTYKCLQVYSTIIASTWLKLWILNVHVSTYFTYRAAVPHANSKQLQLEIIIIFIVPNMIHSHTDMTTATYSPIKVSIELLLI